jgi:hypothetical protein
MKTDSIFVGDIRVCTKYDTHTILTTETYIGDTCIGSDSFGHIEKEDELYKKGAILLKTKNGGYVDLDNLNMQLQLYMAIMSKNEAFYPSSYPQNLIMMTSASYQGSLFVDTQTLKPYKEIQSEAKNNITIKQLRIATNRW